MSEIEQLRKEVNELRERVAKLEARGLAQQGPMWTVPSVFLQPTQPQKVPSMSDAFPPGTIIGCSP